MRTFTVTLDALQELLRKAANTSYRTGLPYPDEGMHTSTINMMVELGYLTETTKETTHEEA